MRVPRALGIWDKGGAAQHSHPITWDLSHVLAQIERRQPADTPAPALLMDDGRWTMNQDSGQAKSKKKKAAKGKKNGVLCVREVRWSFEAIFIWPS